MKEKEISNKPTYQPCWISYLGAVSGSLKSLGKDYDVTDVGGYSGWSFLINVSKGVTCPSGPTAHRAYKDILKGTQSLGFELGGHDDPPCIPAKEGEVTEEERERFRKYFEIVKKEIIEKDRPIVLWGIPVPEYGIVYGFKDDSYIVSTFRHLNNITEIPIPYDKLAAPGGLHHFSFGKELDIDQEIVDKEAIERAVKLTKGGPEITNENYVAGTEAFTEWARVLKNDEIKIGGHNYHGNSYVAYCALEGRDTAVEFLKRLSKRYSGKPQSNYLEKAANAFTKTRDLLKEFVGIFPFAFEGDISKEKRTKGSELLKQAVPHELEALNYLEEAISFWE